jgi:hypothetical protein
VVVRRHEHQRIQVAVEHSLRDVHRSRIGIVLTGLTPA